MRIAWTLGGALFGRALFGKFGLVVGGLLGYSMAADREVARPRRSVGARRVNTGTAAVSASPPESGPLGERYPEETILDAMRESEAEETAGEKEELESPGRVTE